MYSCSLWIRVSSWLFTRRTLVKTWRNVRKLIKEATNILRDGRRAGARHFHIAGDLDKELGLLCTGDEDDQEFREVCGPQRWLGGEADPGGFGKLTWCNIMMEFNCQPVSTWSSCDDRRERACTHKMWKSWKDATAGLHPGPKTDLCTTYIHNKVNLCSTWDHLPVCATMQRKQGTRLFYS